MPLTMEQKRRTRVCAYLRIRHNLAHNLVKCITLTLKRHAFLHLPLYQDSRSGRKYTKIYRYHLIITLPFLKR